MSATHKKSEACPREPTAPYRFTPQSFSAAFLVGVTPRVNQNEQPPAPPPVVSAHPGRSGSVAFVKSLRPEVLAGVCLELGLSATTQLVKKLALANHASVATEMMSHLAPARAIEILVNLDADVLSVLGAQPRTQ